MSRLDGDDPTSVCKVCWATFTDVKAFDKHRAGSHTRGARHGVDPATVGLVSIGQPCCRWGFPGPDNEEAAS